MNDPFNITPKIVLSNSSCSEINYKHVLITKFITDFGRLSTINTISIATIKNIYDYHSYLATNVMTNMFFQ